MKEMNSRQRQALATKKRILDTAFSLLSGKRYEELKMSEIASAAGVSVGTLYHHFQSKESLFFFGYHYFDMMIEQCSEQIRFPSHIEALRSVIYAQTTGAFLRGINFISIVLRIQLSSHASLYIDEQRAFPQYIHSQVRQAIAAGELAPSCDADALCAAILRLARGVIFDCTVRNIPQKAGEHAMYDLDILLMHHLHSPVSSFPPPNPLWLSTYEEWLASSRDLSLL